MSEHRRKFEHLLRELFQFDCADLDFGIYRIMNHKREVIEKFIRKDLLQAVSEELQRDVLAEQQRATEALQETRQAVIEVLGIDALDGDGNLAKQYHHAPLGQKYLDLKARAAHNWNLEALEQNIFNRLHDFFSRYYQDGDFMSKRRYSKRQRYAIPYNGEEVHLHWANSDQYYIKTGEYFRDYRFKVGNISVHFQLQSADIEQNGLKGNKCFFVPLAKDIDWNEKDQLILIPFEYRPLTEQENVAYGTRNIQEAIVHWALDAIPSQLQKAVWAQMALTAKHHISHDGDAITFLQHHLRQYARRNTSDFFIHKNLQGFLSQELDFYLKNEVLNLDEMENAGEHLAGGWFQIMRVIRKIGGKIIDFLHQIESFQKMLWEKRKFITETQYCVTIGNIDESFYSEIAFCEPQWKEWKELFHIDEMKPDLFLPYGDKEDERMFFLKECPALILDTRHFKIDFKDRLLGSIDDLGGATDGLLIHSENFQALNLLQSQFHKQVQCVYIDPPYNTGNDNDFIYKDNYQHSSWMSMMADRFILCRHLSMARAGIFVSTDDGEYAHLKLALEQSWGASNFIADVIWNSRKSVSSDTLISIATNHTTFFALDKNELQSHKDNFRLPGTSDRFSNPDNDPNGPYKLDPMDAPNVRKNLTYEIINPVTGEKFLPPIGRCWRFEKDEAERLLKEGRIVFGKNGKSRPMYKRYLSEAESRGMTPTTLWNDVETTTEATRLLLDLLGDTLLGRDVINSIKPKPNKMIERCAFLLTDDEGIVLDYFAGSGTTAHSVINLNRTDGGRRKSILIEMGQHFHTILLPRIKKITFTPEWKNGKPKRMATKQEAEHGPRIIKYVHLESYEDVLDNISFTDPSSNQQTLELDGYLLKYMLQWETKRSETLLNVEKLESPFSYKLHNYSNGQTSEKAADIPETFNYLLGLQVQTRQIYDDDGRRYLVYRGLAKRKRVAVIWRETANWKKADYERDRKFVARKKLTEGTDEALVNSDSCIPDARSLDPLFKKLMFTPVEA